MIRIIIGILIGVMLMLHIPGETLHFISHVKDKVKALPVDDTLRIPSDSGESVIDILKGQGNDKKPEQSPDLTPQGDAPAEVPSPFLPDEPSPLDQLEQPAPEQEVVQPDEQRSPSWSELYDQISRSRKN